MMTVNRFRKVEERSRVCVKLRLVPHFSRRAELGVFSVDFLQGFEENGSHLFHAVMNIDGIQVPGKTGPHLVSLSLSGFLLTVTHTCQFDSTERTSLGEEENASKKEATRSFVGSSKLWFLRPSLAVNAVRLVCSLFRISSPLSACKPSCALLCPSLSAKTFPIPLSEARENSFSPF